MENLTGVIRFLKQEQDRLTRELQGIGAALAAFGKTYGKQPGSRARRTATTRTGPVRSGNVKAMKTQSQTGAPKKRTMSAAGRKRIADAQRARWAKVKAAKKG
jgi:hypothetical protein